MIEVASGKRWDPERSSAEAEPLRAADLPPATRRRLLARAEIRAQRLKTTQWPRTKDWYWLAAELALVLPTLPPAAVRRWREVFRWGVYHARSDLERMRELEAAILAHEPEPDAWLRRQLGTLTP